MVTEELMELVEAAGFIFVGRAAPADSDARHHHENAVSVQVHRTLRSAEALGDLSGTDVIVVAEHPRALAEHHSLLLFTSVVAVGDRLVTRELAMREASEEAVIDVEEAVRLIGERPLVRRVVEAELIVVGEVVASAPVDDEPDPRRSEHDPEWWIARVAVGSVVKGATRKRTLDVLFAHSRDIAWYRAPKLHEGDGGVLLLQRRNEDEAPAKVAETTYQAIDALDLLPLERLSEVERILESERGGN